MPTKHIAGVPGTGPTQVLELDLDYSALTKMLKPFVVRTRTESRAFLLWYLENLYRLDGLMAEDAVCDGPDDKGIDGLYVDEMNSRVDVFQAKIVQSPARTIGSTYLKEFSGTLDQFDSPEAVENIRDTTTNLELRDLIEALNVPQRMRDGFKVRGVFVTNGRPDPTALAFLAATPAPIALIDRGQIAAQYVPAHHAPPAMHPVTFDVKGFAVSEYRVGSERIVVAPLSGRDLVSMEGIQFGGLFDYNVRQYLGRTNVNKDIAKSIAEPAEHPNFLLYHNGIAIVAEKVDTSVQGKVTIENYVVVNGCQSLSVLWENRAKLTSDLRILARIIELDRSSPLMDRITHHSNNQNGIRPRDFQSNNAIQLRLRSEFEEVFRGRISYQISRGEHVGAAVEGIDNELAARVLLAFDLERPWNAHETYKLFDELYSDVFARPTVNAARIVALVDLFRVAERVTPEVKTTGLANLTLMKFYLLYLVRQAFNKDRLGIEFVRDPARFVATQEDRERLGRCALDVLQDLVVDLEAEVEERENAQGPLDFKRLLKTEKEVRALTKEVMTGYLKSVRRKRTPPFSELWEKGGD
jgi:AIPR protein